MKKRVPTQTMLADESRHLLILAGLIAAFVVGLLLIHGAFHLSVRDIAELILAAIGSVFAFFAFLDASRAFHTSRMVQEEVSSYQTDFHRIMEEMVAQVKNARSELWILLPTPGYGYLFGEMALARELVSALEAFLGQEENKMYLYVVMGNPADPPREWISQRYMRRAYKLEEDPRSRVSAAEYATLVKRMFTALSTAKAAHSLCVLRTDPNVRAIVADSDRRSACSCLLSFAQSNPEEELRGFESKGFTGKRPELAAAVRDLMQVYEKELKVDVPLAELEGYFCVLT